jgi:hypothetical protein
MRIFAICGNQIQNPKSERGGERMRGWSYVLACLVIPAVWGLLASWVYDRVAARRAANRPPDDDRADMFHI